MRVVVRGCASARDVRIFLESLQITERFKFLNLNVCVIICITYIVSQVHVNK